jgi:urate oxidase
MGIVLGANGYGKAQIRLVRVRHGDHGDDISDLNVSVMLEGDFGRAFTEGDNSAVLTTDAQKNTVYAFAGQHPASPVEEFGLLLARHFRRGAVDRARVTIEQYPWDRVAEHSFSRAGSHVRTATVSCDGDGENVSAGLAGMTLLNTTGSEFRGFLVDEYTTLAETSDRILATDVTATWRYSGAAQAWDEAFDAVRGLLVSAFARTYSYSLQHTLYAMGQAVLDRMPSIAAISLSLPNKHHVETGEPGVYYASDRPYGLIEGTVTRD